MQTRRAVIPRFSRPAPRGIHIEVTGDAHSLDEALTAFSAAAEAMSPIVSVVANAPVGTLDVELAFDSSPGVSERAFFQQFLLDERVMPIDPHEVPNSSLKAVLELLPRHPDNERLHRAMAYYHTAISAWRPGSEIPVLAYLYMAAEALTPVVLATFVEQAGSKSALQAKWGIDIKQMDSEARCRGVFEGDVAVYKKARNASDGFEHGFAKFTDIRADADQVLLPTAAYIRSAIFRQLALPAETLQQLLSPPYDRPFYLHYTKFLRGTLISDGEALAAPDQLYPILTWRSSHREVVPQKEGDDPGIAYDERIGLKVASGVRLAEATVHVVGPRGSVQSVLVSSESKPMSPNRRATPLVVWIVAGALLLLLIAWLALVRG